MNVITEEKIKNELMDYEVFGEVGIVTIRVVNIKKPTLLSEISDNWMDYVENSFEEEFQGLENCDCVIRKRPS